MGNVIIDWRNNMGKPQEESKRDRFIRVAENRTNRILDTLDLLGNCANKGNYDYTEQDVKKIFDTIQKKLDETRQRYAKQSKNEKFKL